MNRSDLMAASTLLSWMICSITAMLIWGSLSLAAFFCFFCFFCFLDFLCFLLRLSLEDSELEELEDEEDEEELELDLDTSLEEYLRWCLCFLDLPRALECCD